MVEIGIREFKARLSYYVQLMQAGETIAIKVRDRVVGFLSQSRPPSVKSPKTSPSSDDRFIKKLQAEGRLWGGGRYHHRPFKPIRLTPGPTTTEMIRQMRDEES
jgi:antitoxin (DNA-binding transcriptional repressor) of toxin-antitoxin stability system